MRILFLINFYMVPGSGGEDLSCQQVIRGLQQRGHTTLVLTSMRGTDNIPVEADGVYRSLFLEMDLVPLRHSIIFFTARKAREKHNLQCFERVVDQFKPDIIFIWGIWNLPRSLPAFAESRYPEKVVYRFGTYWPTLPSQHEFYWRTPGRKWYSRLLKKVLRQAALSILAKEDRRLPLAFEHAICVSAATKKNLIEAGIPIMHAKVIYTGLDVQQYLQGLNDRHPRHEMQEVKLLYAGRLYPEKGVDTAIHALKTLVFELNLQNIKLSVVGSGSPDYEKDLRRLVDETGLQAYVSFSGHIPAEGIPQLLQNFDVLLVPSIWQEPFSRVVLEGMVSGMVVIASTTGGTTEILADGKNGLLFAPGDAEDLAQKIAYLANDPELIQKLALAGQQTVAEGFTMAKMMDEIEGYLQETARTSTQTQANPFENPIEAVDPERFPTVSVIIPTYNRKDMLRSTLHSLAQQTYPKSNFEIIVVDDGSTDGTEQIAAEQYPFTLRYFRQSNQSATAARNLGATQSQADILVFLDDDILAEPDYLTYLIREHATSQKRIVVGKVNIQCDERAPLSQILDKAFASNQNSQELAFTDVYSNNMSIRRKAYIDIGMYQDLGFLGSSSWCDVDLGYRAYQQGLDFCRSLMARCSHRDYFACNLDRYKKRVRTSAYQAVFLFHKYPELRSHLTMFNDKTPILWVQDPPSLIARKLARSVFSSRPVLWSMEQIAFALEKTAPSSNVLALLYRYIIGGYIYHGYREGLQKFLLAGVQG